MRDGIEEVKAVLKKKFAIDDYEKLKEKLKDAKTLLYSADNAER